MGFFNSFRNRALPAVSFILLTALFSLISFSQVSAADTQVYLKSGYLSYTKPTQSEIAQRHSELIDADSLYEMTPSVVSPYSAGEVSEANKQSALTYINYVRYLAGVKDNVTINSSLQKSAQNGALLMAVTGHFGHTGFSRPSGMSTDTFRSGSYACFGSDIFAGWGFEYQKLLRTSVQSYMDDFDSVSNMKEVGHRRWILSPRFLYTGIGLVRDADDEWQYTALRVMKSTGDDVDPQAGTAEAYNFIAWPSSGNFPAAEFDQYRPWSVSLNPAVYKTPSLSAITATLSRINSDGSLTPLSTVRPDDQDFSGYCRGKYLTLNSAGYGNAGPAVIFNFADEAGGTEQYSGSYAVTVTGLTLKSDSSSASIVYRINFFDYNTAASDEITYESSAASAAVTGKQAALVSAERKPLSTYINADSAATEKLINSEYNISLDADGGTLSADSMTVGYGDNPLLGIPEKEGYSFDGWYTSSGVRVTEDAPYFLSADSELTARYSKPADKADPDSMKFSISKITPGTYTGSALTPSLTVKAGGIVLKNSSDYEVTYRDNVDAGTASVTVTGRGYYSSLEPAESSFLIRPRNISRAYAWVETVCASDNAIEPTYYVFDTAGEVSENDCRAEKVKGSSDGTKAGNVKLRLSGMNNYCGTKYITGKVLKANNSNIKHLINSDYFTVRLNTTASLFRYWRSAYKPAVIVKNSSGDIVDASEYRLKYANNVNAGTAEVIVTGCGKALVGTKILTFTILPYDLGVGSVSFNIADKSYTVPGVTPAVRLYAGYSTTVNKKNKIVSWRLKDLTECVQLFHDSSNAGTACVEVTGRGNYLGCRYDTYSIVPADIARTAVIKKDRHGVITVTCRKRVLKEGIDYTVSDDPANSRKLIISGIGNFKGEKKISR